ncbi:MAG: hypothetical protein CMO81_05880 [Waddliaceae bacterium]|nr:hypothetical protein [Waddliaceae bacterium]
MNFFNSYARRALFWICSILFGFLVLACVQESLVVDLPTEERPIVFYSSEIRTDLRLTFQKAIEKAQKSILLCTYTIGDVDIIRSLRHKAEQGVEIQVVSDRKASGDAPKLLGEKIRCVLKSDQGLMHRKILIIDNQLVFIGSANLSTDSLRVQNNLVSGIYSPDLAHYLNDALFRPTSSSSYFSQKIATQQIEVFLLPQNTQAEDRVLELLSTAKKTLRVAMFTWTNPKITQAVCAAKARGVDVEVLLDRQSSQKTSAKVAEALKDHGIPVFLNRHSQLLHHKFAVIDDETLILGSANWTRAAFEKNAECFFVLSPLEERQKTCLDKLWKTTRLESVLYKNVHLP